MQPAKSSKQSSQTYRAPRGQSTACNAQPCSPRDDGGGVQQTPVTHDVRQHQALQVLLEKPVLNDGIGQRCKTAPCELPPLPKLLCEPFPTSVWSNRGGDVL